MSCISVVSYHRVLASILHDVTEDSPREVLVMHPRARFWATLKAVPIIYTSMYIHVQKMVEKRI